MPLDIDRFIQLRPFVYHVTARENRAALANTMTIEPAATLIRWAGRTELLRLRRAEPISLNCGVETIVLKDQAVLSEKNLVLEDGWAFGDFLEYLNEHVFFWPGTMKGSSRSGVRLKSRYSDKHQIEIRIPTESLFSANLEGIPLFCPFNSGAPRQQNGHGAFRGSNLFAVAADFARRESEVVELAYRSSVYLPADTMVQSAERWVPLRAGAA